MLYRIAAKFIEQNISRWLVLAIDLFLCLISFIVATTLINQFNMPFNYVNLFYIALILLLFRLQAFIITKSYTGIIKFTGTQDAVRISIAIGLSSFVLWIISNIYSYNTQKIFISDATLALDACLSIILLTTFRVGAKLFYQEMKNTTDLIKKNVVILGAGKSGLILKRTLENDPYIKFKIIAFIDENEKLQGKSAEGVPIYVGIDKFDYLQSKYEIDELILAIPQLDAKKKKTIIEKVISADVKIKSIPPIDTWVNGQFQSKEIQNLAIEDLLGRNSINLEKENIKEYLEGKTVLVTGAAGSIGSEIVRQCLHFNVQKVIAIDQAETAIHDLLLELKSTKKLIPLIADVRNKERIETVFAKHKPEIVFHAAAYKHVPLMEDNPYEAIHTNVFGTKVIADISVKYQVKTFIYISTDKAVNPTNIMGASKRISEIYVQSLNEQLSLENKPHTAFITTRFGNVLGSNGSVIPLFNEQIQKGGPITVTHPEINRYFMTIPEACQLVLEAGAMGKGGEIFIFDMGEPVKIIDLAEKMIRLKGYKPHKDIEIVFTGLRPGEKLKEELLNTKENTIGTYHPKIMIAQVPQYNYLEVTNLISSMQQVNLINNSRLLVSIMKQIVPEYISNNSIYEELDKKIATSN